MASGATAWGRQLRAASAAAAFGAGGCWLATAAGPVQAQSSGSGTGSHARDCHLADKPLFIPVETAYQGRGGAAESLANGLSIRCAVPPKSTCTRLHAPFTREWVAADDDCSLLRASPPLPSSQCVDWESFEDRSHPTRSDILQIALTRACLPGLGANADIPLKPAALIKPNLTEWRTVPLVTGERAASIKLSFGRGAVGSSPGEWWAWYRSKFTGEDPTAQRPVQPPARHSADTPSAPPY